MERLDDKDALDNHIGDILTLIFLIRKKRTTQNKRKHYKLQYEAPTQFGRLIKNREESKKEKKVRKREKSEKKEKKVRKKEKKMRKKR